MMRHQLLAVALPRGVHARIATLLAQRAAGFQSSLFLTRPDTGATASLARSLDLLSLGLAHGDEVMLLADGPDAEEALAAVAQLLLSPTE